MRAFRTVVLLMLVAVLLVVANHYLAHRSITDPARRINLVGPVYDASCIEVHNHGELSVRLARDRNGGWRLISPYACVADEQKMMRFLDVVSNVRVLDAVRGSDLSRMGRTTADFHLTDPLLSVSITMPDGTKIRFSTGIPTPSADGLYAVVDGVDALFTIQSDAIGAVGMTADDFRRRSLFRVGADAVRSFVVRHGDETRLSFARTASGWTVNDEKASKERVNGLLDAIVGAEAESFVWPTGATGEPDRLATSVLAAYELESDHAISILLQCSDGAERKLVIGRTSDNGSAYALIYDPMTVVTVADSLRSRVASDCSVFTDTRLFPVEMATVTAFTVADGRTSCSLMRNIDGGWRLESPISAAADPNAVKTVLERICVLNSSDVAANGIAVSVGTNSPAVMVPRELVLGSSAMESFRSLEVVNIGTRQIKRLVQNRVDKEGGKSVSVCLDRERRAWNVESASVVSEVDEGNVKRVLAALSPLMATAVVKLRVQASDLGAYGLDCPLLTIAVDLESEDSVRRNIIIGGAYKGGRYVTVGSADAVFLVPDRTLSELFIPLVK